VLLLPQALGPFIAQVIAYVALYVLMGLGLNITLGFAGLLDLGFVAFFAVGAYTVGLLTSYGEYGLAHLSFWAVVPIAIFVAFMIGAFLGLPVLRIRGDYLAIATLGFGIAVHQVLINWEWLSGGRAGLFVPKLTFAGRPLGDAEIYWIALIVSAALTVLAFHIVRSYVGRAFVAIRDSDIAAEVMGVSLTTYKTTAFAVSAAYAGLGGGLYAIVLHYLEPNQFTLLESITYFSMIVVGGLGTIPGSVLGAALLTILPLEFSGFRQWQPVVYGLAIIVVMALEPRGVYGRWLKIKRWFKTWPF